MGSHFRKKVVLREMWWDLKKKTSRCEGKWTCRKTTVKGGSLALRGAASAFAMGHRNPRESFIFRGDDTLLKGLEPSFFQWFCSPKVEDMEDTPGCKMRGSAR